MKKANALQSSLEMTIAYTFYFDVDFETRQQTQGLSLAAKFRRDTADNDLQEVEMLTILAISMNW